MKKATRMKKRMAMLLSGVLTFGMVAGIIPGNTLQVQAAGTTSPELTRYATKAQLMDSTFAPKTDGTLNNIGKLVFGRNSDREAQKWYILGKDNSVPDDNMMILACTPIAKGRQFNATTADKDNQESYYDTYVEEPGVSGVPSTILANHYGASDLRQFLQELASNPDYFTAVEQALMQPTTVNTTDVRNGRVYKTTDYLYAVKGYTDRQEILLGGYEKELLCSTYFPNENFWLRAAYSKSPNYGCAAAWSAVNNKISPYNVNASRDVCPATNLDLSDVLFASTYKAATEEFSAGEFTLRLDGSGKDIGSVTYDLSTGTIKAVKGGTSSDVWLVVQFTAGTAHCALREAVLDEYELTVSKIEEEMQGDSVAKNYNFDLSTCKIWLEITDSNGMIYAVEATEVLPVTEISTVTITDIDTPVSTTSLDTSAVCGTTGVSTTAPAVTWTPGNAAAGYNTSYTASVTLTADTNYEFADSVTATVNGNPATSVTKNEDGTLTVTYAFPATDKDKLVSITEPGSVTVANGTAYADMNLPAQVHIVTEGGTVDQAEVTWNTTNPKSGSYDPAVMTEQTVTLEGTVTCPDQIDANGVVLTTSITITISAAGIVGAPTASVESGTYTTNQSVALETTTEGAAIYYTTNGTEPSRSAGTRYDSPITVAGMAGQSFTTTIKAIAVKDGMQDSEVKTFTYTIAIPEAVEVPVIITQPKDVTVKAGEKATFTVTAEGSDLQYQWSTYQKRGTGWVVISGADGPSYTIDVTDKSMDGFKYQCTVSNKNGKAYSDAAKLTVLDDTDPNPDPEPDSYEILDGANSKWTQNSDGSLAITGNGDFDKFLNVKVDGEIIDPENYTAKKGSTIITLKASYLQTLTVGSHTFTIVWTGGEASTNFTVAKKSNNNNGNNTGNNNGNNNGNAGSDNSNDNGSNNASTTAVQTADNKNSAAGDVKDEVPKTGDTSNRVLGTTLFMAALAGLAGMFVRTKKKECK